MLSELEQAKLKLADAVLKAMRVRRDYRIMPINEVAADRTQNYYNGFVQREARRVESLMTGEELRKAGLR